MIVWPSQNSLMYAFFFVAFASNLSVAKTVMNKTQPSTSHDFNESLWSNPSKRATKIDSLFNNAKNLTDSKNGNECPKLSGSRACHGYARRWIRFYLEVWQ